MISWSMFGVFLIFFHSTFVLNVLAQVCGQSPPSTAMAGAAEKGAWPWMAAVMIRDSDGSYSFWGAGFLVDSRHVIAAAQMFENIEPGLYKVHVGDVEHARGIQHDVIKVVVPEGYTSDHFYDDIAILTLDKAVSFPGFNPICLPHDEMTNRSFEGQRMITAGWGATEIDGEMSPVLNQFREIPVVSNRDCNRTFHRVSDYQLPRGVTAGILCAGFVERGIDVCHGDSGAPLMFREDEQWFAVGISSFGFLCGIPGYPAGYTRVSAHLDWIRSHLRTQ